MVKVKGKLSKLFDLCNIMIIITIINILGCSKNKRRIKSIMVVNVEDVIFFI